MPIFDPKIFEGTLALRDHSASISFDAGIDDEGGLMLNLRDIRQARAGLAFLLQGEPLQP